MGIKYKLKLRDLKLEYLIDYFKPVLKFFKRKEKINNYVDLKNFIQTLKNESSMLSHWYFLSIDKFQKSLNFFLRFKILFSDDVILIMYGIQLNLKFLGDFLWVFLKQIENPKSAAGPWARVPNWALAADFGLFLN